MAQTGPVAAYGFEEGTGTFVGDASGNGNPGTIAGATWTAGRHGTALDFDGSAMVVVPDSKSLDLDRAMTLEAWVYPTAAAGAWRDVIFKAVDMYYLEGSSPGAAPAVGGTFLGNSATDPLYGTGALPLHTWSHLAATYDGAVMRLYVDGVVVASRPQTGRIKSSPRDLTIGGDAEFGQYWAGRIDEVRIYDRALSASEIQSDADTPVTPTLPPSAPGGKRVETILFVDGPAGAPPPTGFRLHLGSQPGLYSSVVDIGMPPAGPTGVRAYTFEVDREATPHIALTAYDAAGRASGLSNEIERAPRRPAFDHDGRGSSDLLLVDPTASSLRLVRSDGSTTLAATGIAPPPQATIAAQGDFDGDGTTDLLWSRQGTRELTLWLLDPGGALRIARLPTPPPSRALFGSGDLDGDADADLVFEITTSPGTLMLWFMEGGAVGNRVPFAGLRKPWSLVGIGDVDADRRADLVWRHKGNGRVEAWLMNADGVLDEVELTVGKEWEALGLGDYDGDGASDLVLRHRQDGRLDSLSILDGASAGTLLATGPAPGSELALGRDFDADGFADLVRVDPFRRLAQLELLGPDAPGGSVEIDLARVALPADFAKEVGDGDNDWNPDYCDADFDNDGVVGSADLHRIQECFGMEAIDGCSGIDMDGDGAIGVRELNAGQHSLGAAPCSDQRTP